MKEKWNMVLRKGWVIECGTLTRVLIDEYGMVFVRGSGWSSRYSDIERNRLRILPREIKIEGYDALNSIVRDWCYWSRPANSWTDCSIQ